MPPIYKSTVKWYSVKKYFGFILSPTGGDDIFMHGSALPEGFVPQDGQSVNYEIANDKHGRPTAVNVVAG